MDHSQQDLKSAVWAKLNPLSLFYVLWTLFHLQTFPPALFLPSLHPNHLHPSDDSAVKNLPALQETQVRSLGWEDPLEKKMATRSSILTWEILQTEESGGLQSMGSKELDTT